eukprot:235384_1
MKTKRYYIDQYDFDQCNASANASPTPATPMAFVQCKATTAMNTKRDCTIIVMKVSPTPQRHHWFQTNVRLTTAMNTKRDCTIISMKVSPTPQQHQCETYRMKHHSNKHKM